MVLAPLLLGPSRRLDSLLSQRMTLATLVQVNIIRSNVFGSESLYLATLLGMYFTSSAEYALPYYASKEQPALLVSLLLPGTPSTVLRDPC